MKKIITTLLLTLALGTILVPFSAAAETGIGGSDTGDKGTPQELAGGMCTSLVNYSEKGYNNPCITEEDKKNGKIYTVLEEVLDTPGLAGDRNTVRTCYRYTEILNGCIVKGETGKQQSNLALLAAGAKSGCPVDIPRSGVDTFGQSFECHEVTVIIADPTSGGIGFLQIYISLIYRWAAGLIGIIAVLIIVISGVQISASNGEPEAATKAKERIVQALSGLALLFLASALLYIINPTFFTPPSGSTTTEAPATPAK